jgi:hypothetical protein
MATIDAMVMINATATIDATAKITVDDQRNSNNGQ